MKFILPQSLVTSAFTGRVILQVFNKRSFPFGVNILHFEVTYFVKWQLEIDC